MRGHSAIEILDRAVNLLRTAPAGAVAVYLAGAVPFILALLFFISDMSRSPFASEHVGAASLTVALLYVWKNVWQGVFMAKLYAMLSPGRTGARRLARLIAIQAAFQPLGLALMLPFPWLIAFFRNVALFAALGVPKPVSTARRQATLWTRQNWGVLSLVGLAGILLLANFLIVIVTLPQLARSFLGIEGDFARLGLRILNLTTVSVGAALAWLVIDPLLDAVYVLRCFYGESIATGEDLRAALRRATGTIATAALLATILGVQAPPAFAQTHAQSDAQSDPQSGAQNRAQAQTGRTAIDAQSLDQKSLDRSIDDVIHRREFIWRAPRPAGEEPKGHWVGWVHSMQDTVRRFIEWAANKIRDWFESNRARPDGTGQNAPVTPRMLETLIAVAVVLAVGAALVWFRKPRSEVVRAEPVAVAAAFVNLADESVTADQLSESSWLKLAEEWLAKGDCRLAMRALYLAALNYLTGNGMVSIRRWKSGLDYQREVERRARANPEIGRIFARNLALFERGWYGRHGVDREMVEAFAAGLGEMKVHVRMQASAVTNSDGTNAGETEVHAGQ